MITFSARWSLCRRARPVARRVLYAAARVALCARFGVPGAVRFARFAVPDGALFPTSARLWAASWAWRAPWWSGLPPVTPSELQAWSQVQTPPRIQIKRVHYDDRPASIPNVHPCQAPGLLPSCTSHKFQRAGIDLNQPGRCRQIHIAHDDRAAGNGDLLPDLPVR